MIKTLRQALPTQRIICEMLTQPGLLDQHFLESSMREPMTDTTQLAPNTLFIGVTGSGLPEVDGLYVASVAQPA